ncbi:hypothetical protein IGI04_013597 [Brassica rapa subsp. trilocularis]|uniref:Uncharacterized protein n=1 Tax=Brassica rapa subsp. trilocularis TaxID=1813537 RepID=A0ABQ7N9A5_BRACM|nr:hypothetical protein IGI04_013597 [Brassica rapa subsp. trilocularis]
MYFLLIYLFCTFLIKWYSSSTNLKVFQIWKTSGTTYLLVVWKSSGLLGSLLTKSSGLPGSRLDFLEVIWTSWKSSDEIWKTSGTTYLLVVWKSSGLLGSLLTKSSRLPVKSSGLPVKSSGLPVKSSGSRLNFLKSSDKVSSGLTGSLLTKFSSISSGIQALDDLTFSRLRLQISKSIAKITSALTRRLPGFSKHTESQTKVAHPESLASPSTQNHKNFRIKILGFLAHCGEKVRDMLCLVHKNGKKKKGKSILGALRASNWLFMVVVVLMTMAIL